VVDSNTKRAQVKIQSGSEKKKMQNRTGGKKEKSPTKQERGRISAKTEPRKRKRQGGAPATQAKGKGCHKVLKEGGVGHKGTGGQRWASGGN